VILFHPKLIDDGQEQPACHGNDPQPEQQTPKGSWEKHHLMFVPPPGQSDLSPFEHELSELAERERAMLYAINPESMSPVLRKQLAFIDSAILHLRAGCSHLKVLVPSEGMRALVMGMKHFRIGRDEAVNLRGR
jgi:hypothetical protein